MSAGKVLRTRRGHVFASVTKITGFFEKFDQSIHTIEEIETRIEKLKDDLKRFYEVQCEIECLDDVDEGKEEEKVTLFETNYHTAMSMGLQLIKLFNPKDSPTTKVTPQTIIHNFPSKEPSLRLPVLTLPSFDGALQNWLAFRDAFESTIHDNKDLVPVQKLSYLKRSLVGGVSVTVDAIETTAANYEIAWKLLLDRYDNKKALINSHIKILFGISSVQKESAQELRQLLDECMKQMRILEQLGEPVKHWDSILVFHISSKLDTITLREWETKNAELGKTIPTMDIFKQFIEQKCQVLESVASADCHVPTISSSKQPVNSKRVHLVTDSVQVQGKSCSFCKKQHQIFYCESFLKLGVSDRI